VTEEAQLAALAAVCRLFAAHGLDYWLFGGWAVDFHAGTVSGPHDDLDLAVWAADRDRIAGLLTGEGWRHAPEEGEDGYTGFEREGVRLELAFLAQDEDGVVYTRLAEGRGSWPEESFGEETGELRGLRVRVVGLAALRADKSAAHADPHVAEKDRADLDTLGSL
jgi:hypothetical protein